jgi:predicted NACHT family NTPase
MTRTVRRTNVAHNKREDATPRPFSSFSHERNLVLLGDPGAGKTHVFKESASTEEAVFIKARAFLLTPPARLAGRSLFIDGLDEKRAGRFDRDTADTMVEKLFEVGPAKVRISCRVADWLGDSDLAAFNVYFEQYGQAPVLVLEVLSKDERIAVLAGEGLEAGLAEAFLREADERGLGDFLENPQNLIMLWRAVKTGSWPVTRRQLFELATELMIQEFDPDRARSGSGVCSVAELRPVAGALCATRLISDVEAISLQDQEGTLGIPSYRSLTGFEPAKVQAALGRRVFEAGTELETVDYAHRTTAEYLAGAFLASRVRGGLPLGRVTALIGIDGHPAPELRGLHAWLTVHLPEFADQLIDADPYGILAYGDAASLSTSSCVHLLRALARLSNENPWFRSGNWQSRPVGGLARRDMVPELRALLGSDDVGFGVRSIVIDALLLGLLIPEMIPDLAEIVRREAYTFVERSHALAALLRHGDAGKTAVLDIFRSGLGRSINALRIRSEIIQKFYADPLGADDVIALVDDTLETNETVSTGILWTLADKVPVADAPRVLDDLRTPREIRQGSDRQSREVGSFYGRLLVRVWRSSEPFNAGRAMRWLRKRIAYREGNSESHARDLRAAMRDTPERLQAMADEFFTQTVIDDQRWLTFNRFREATLLEISTEQLMETAVAQLDRAGNTSEREKFLYEIGLALSYHAERQRGEAVFERLYNLADAKKGLAELRAALTRTNLPDGYFHGRTSGDLDSDDSEQGRERQRAEFQMDMDQIRSGAHKGWLAHLAQIYFAQYSDVDRSLTPRERLGTWLGSDKVPAAIEGLLNSLAQADAPTFAQVLTLTDEHQHFEWWLALVAGLNERWSAEPSLDGISEDLLQGLIAYDLTNPVWNLEDGTERVATHPWKTALLESCPVIIRDAYLAVVKLRLTRSEEYVEGLHELTTEPSLEPYQKDFVLELLREFPNARPQHLVTLLDAAIKTPEVHAGALDIARDVLSGNTSVDNPQHDLWLVTAYVMAPQQFELAVEQCASIRPGLVFDLRDRAHHAFHDTQDQNIPLPVLEFRARLTGSAFPDVPHPSGGWGGDRNPWDASEHFRNLLNRISALSSEAATSVLVRLENNAALASYRPHLLHALANQRQRRRDAEYDRPDWAQTVQAIDDGAPATVADLHALVVDHLEDWKSRIRRDNADIWKMFWNVDGYARAVSPKAEEACRDVILILIRSALMQRGVTVEPEGHMAEDRRADISCAMPFRKILCELKRDYNSELWTAPVQQLERFYAHDPDAKGFGVYCVFWFGQRRPQDIPSPPNGLPRPQGANELEEMLRNLCPETMKRRIATVVLDVSVPSI